MHLARVLRNGNLVAGPGVEPGTKAYETFMIPFQYPAAYLYLAPVEGIEPPSTVLETAVMPLYHTGIVIPDFLSYKKDSILGSARLTFRRCPALVALAW